jgi:Protein of unknown function (DUF1217)
VLTTSASYQIVSTDIDRSLARTASQPQVARESEDYLAKIEDIKSVDDFLKNDRVYRYAMKAHGLEDMIYAKAFMKKVLTEGLTNPDSFANTLSDSRYREFAKVFDFAANGETTTIFEAAKQGTVERYIRQTLEQQAGEQNEGVRLALYFARKAPQISSTLSILADKALITVVQTALGIPAQTSLLDLDKQVDLLSKRIDIADFKDPEKLDRFITRFTALWEQNNPSSTQNSNPLAIAQPVEIGIGVDLLSSLQNLKLGGR